MMVGKLVSYWVSVTFQELSVKLREGIRQFSGGEKNFSNAPIAPWHGRGGLNTTAFFNGHVEFFLVPFQLKLPRVEPTITGAGCMSMKQTCTVR